MIHEYSGADTSSPLDKDACNPQASVTNATNAVTSGNITTVSAKELLFGWGNPDNGTLSAGTNFTLRQVSASGGVTEDRIVTSTGTYAATETDNCDDTYMMIATFKAAN